MNIVKITQQHTPKIVPIGRLVPRRNLTVTTPISSTNFTPGLLSSSCFVKPPIIKVKATSFFVHNANNKSEEYQGIEDEDLAADGVVYQNTLRLVECSMLAAVTGLFYFLSNSLSVENYLGCFFSLPIVISSLRWGISAGRKTVVATAMLLFVLSGPVKPLVFLVESKLEPVYLLVYNCQSNRGHGITINIHASLTFIFAAAGINTVPSMNLIYTIFGVLVVLNSGFFVFLLHLLYAVFLTRLGMKDSLRLPRWLEKAL